MATQLMLAARDPVARRIQFVKSNKARYEATMPEIAIVLNPRYVRNHIAQLARASGENGADSLHSAAAAEATADLDGSDEAAKRDDGVDAGKKRKRPPNCDDDDPLFNDPEEVLSRYTPPLTWLRVAAPGCGLENSRNTCFLNSVLQCLAYAPPLAEFLATCKSKTGERFPDGELDWLAVLAATITRMRAGPANKTLAVNTITQNLKKLSKHFILGRHCDAQEFAGALIDAAQMSSVRRQMGKDRKVSPRAQHTSALMRVVGGYTVSQLSWSVQQELHQLRKAGQPRAAKDLEIECQAKKATRLYSNTYEQFTMAHLPVGGPTLEQCLAKFCTVETIDGQVYQTPRKVGVDITKQFMFHALPPVLVLHLKRFTNSGAKLGKKVTFPSVLDMAPFTSENGKLDACDGQGRILYGLTGVVVHFGSSIAWGHYIAFAKSSSGAWLQIDDESVSTVSEELVMRAEAYMLFYSRIPPEATKAPQHHHKKLQQIARPKEVVSTVTHEPSEEEMRKYIERKRAEKEAAAAAAAAAAATAGEVKVVPESVAFPEYKSLQAAVAAAATRSLRMKDAVAALQKKAAATEEDVTIEPPPLVLPVAESQVEVDAGDVPHKKKKRQELSEAVTSGETPRRLRMKKGKGFAPPTPAEIAEQQEKDAEVGEFLRAQQHPAAIGTGTPDAAAANGEQSKTFAHPTRDDEYNASLDRGRAKKMHRKGYEFYQQRHAGHNVFQETAEKKRSGTFVPPKRREESDEENRWSRDDRGGRGGRGGRGAARGGGNGDWGARDGFATGRGACHSCGQFGHFVANCPKRGR